MNKDPYIEENNLPYPIQNELIEENLNIGKTPPQVINIEESILGAIILEKDALTLVIDMIRTENFYLPSHQEIYKAILSLFHDNQSIDLHTVVNALKKKGKLESVGGSYYISLLTTKISSSANIEYHARILVEHSLKRALIQAATQIHRKAYEDTVDVFDLLDETEQTLFEISSTNICKDYTPISGLVKEAYQQIDELRQNQHKFTGVPSGFTNLDRVTGGWQKSDFVVIASRPGMGKTSFILSMLRHAAIDQKMAVAIFSLEMASIQLANRFISLETLIDHEKIKKGRLSFEEWKQIGGFVTQMENIPLYIDDTPAISIFELRAKCRRLKAKHDIQMIVIDYLQLMSGNLNKYQKGNREQEIASISRSLKILAKELNIPVMALSQLSRAVEIRGGSKKPLLSDLRESGAIEQDADLVLFLYRPEYYQITEDDEGNSVKGLAEIIIAKNRNGKLDTVTLQFMKEYMKFQDLILDDTLEQTEEVISIKSRLNEV